MVNRNWGALIFIEKYPRIFKISINCTRSRFLRSHIDWRGTYTASLFFVLICILLSRIHTISFFVGELIMIFLLLILNAVHRYFLNIKLLFLLFLLLMWSIRWCILLRIWSFSFIIYRVLLFMTFSYQMLRVIICVEIHFNSNFSLYIFQNLPINKLGEGVKLFLMEQRHKIITKPSHFALSMKQWVL